MAVRLLLMFSVLIVQLTAMIVGLLGVSSLYPVRMREGGIAACVAIVTGTVVLWLLTIALFVRGASKGKARRLVEQARIESARILAVATEQALALSSLDAGRCRKCGNPRTGKFCPKCGVPAEAA